MQTHGEAKEQKPHDAQRVQERERRKGGDQTLREGGSETDQVKLAPSLPSRAIGAHGIAAGVLARRPAEELCNERAR